jgi:hypothetical protein
MYINAKMIPAETVPGIRVGGWKRAEEGVNSSVIYLIHCKNLCKCYNVPPPITTKIKNKIKYAFLLDVLPSCVIFPHAKIWLENVLGLLIIVAKSFLMLSNLPGNRNLQLQVLHLILWVTMKSFLVYGQ